MPSWLNLVFGHRFCTKASERGPMNFRQEKTRSGGGQTWKKKKKKKTRQMLSEVPQKQYLLRWRSKFACGTPPKREFRCEFSRFREDNAGWWPGYRKRETLGEVVWRRQHFTGDNVEKKKRKKRRKENIFRLGGKETWEEKFSTLGRCQNASSLHCCLLINNKAYEPWSNEMREELLGITHQFSELVHVCDERDVNSTNDGGSTDNRRFRCSHALQISGQSRTDHDKQG